MEARPHPIAEAVVAWLLPPACREHVVGDLHERYVSAGQYAWDALRTIPFAVWGQVRRTSSLLLAVTQFGAVYIGFSSALARFDSPALVSGNGAIRLAIPALAALVTMVLRDAWVGRAPRSRSYVALDGVLGVAAAAMTEATLRMFGSFLSLEPAVTLAGCATGLLLLACARVSLCPLGQPSTTAHAGAPRNLSPANKPGGMQRDLRLWWWTIAVVGFTGGVGLLAYPAFARVRPLILVWLVAFAAIGLYQRRRTLWPQRPTRGSAISEWNAYRTSLERRRDEQYQWPARRRPVLAGTVTTAFLVGLARFFDSANSPRPLLNGFMGPLAIAAIAFAMYVFTRKMTDRAASAFQRELDDASQPPKSNGD